MEKLLRAYLDRLHPPLSKVMQAIKKKAKKDEVPIVSDEIGRLLCFLVSLKKPKKILELGTGLSYATHWLLLGNKDSTVFSVEQNKDRILLSEKFLKASNILSRVRLYSGWIEDFFLSNSDKFDFVFLDSQKSTYSVFLDNISKRLKSSGLLIADNALFQNQVFSPINSVPKNYRCAVQGIKKFNKDIFAHSQFESFLFPVGDGMLLSVKK